MVCYYWSFAEGTSSRMVVLDASLLLCPDSRFGRRSHANSADEEEALFKDARRDFRLCLRHKRTERGGKEVRKQGQG